MGIKWADMKSGIRTPGWTEARYRNRRTHRPGTRLRIRIDHERNQTGNRTPGVEAWEWISTGPDIQSGIESPKLMSRKDINVVGRPPRQPASRQPMETQPSYWNPKCYGTPGGTEINGTVSKPTK
jgi:hypothetical protein